MQTIIVACGAGVATSTVITDGVSRLLSEKGIEFRIIQCSLNEVPSYVDQSVLIISSMPLHQHYRVPVVLGIPFLTGVGLAQTKENILSVLTK